jgi:hypothetical protein
LAVAALKVAKHMDHSSQSGRRLNQVKSLRHAFNKLNGALMSQYQGALQPYLKISDIAWARDGFETRI